VTQGLAIQIGSIARRQIVRTLRQPAAVFFPIAFPLTLMLVNAGGLTPATRLPGFPTDSFYAFALAIPFIQGALFATMNAGTDLARDIQDGFFNRLALTPLRSTGLLVGLLAGVVTLGLAQSVIYLVVGLAIGVAGMLVLLLLSAVILLAFGAIGATAALRTGSGEAVQGLFPAFFVFLFISSMNMPRNLIEIDWFRTAATANPVSYLIEGVRSLIITGWDAEALALAFGVASLLAIAALVAASLSMRTRMERT
jgi:ABC-2 type transport system permease protein